jgi:hypothetical protein
MIGAELLQRHVGIGRLVRRVGIDQHRLLVGHHLLEDRGDDLRLANHCRRIFVSSLVASVLSSRIARVDQRYGKASRLSSSSSPGVVAVGKPVIVSDAQMLVAKRGSSPPVSG